MCCSVSPGVPVRFSNTILYAAEIDTPTDGVVHVLGYQNKVQNRPRLLKRAAGAMALTGTGNAMILPFPAVPATMTEANVVDTDACRDILQDIAASVAPPTVSMSAAAGRAKGLTPPRIQVFASGIYTVVLAQDAAEIPSALGQVPRDKRPALNPALFEAYAAWYPDRTVALCCFNNRKARLAAPMLWWYRPMHDDRLLLPTLDCHTGDVPDLDASVPLDHVVAVTSYRLNVGAYVHYRGKVPADVDRYLRPWVVGERYNGSMPNGDFICRLDDVRAGRFRPARVGPVPI